MNSKIALNEIFNNVLMIEPKKLGVLIDLFSSREEIKVEVQEDNPVGMNDYSGLIPGRTRNYSVEKMLNMGIGVVRIYGSLTKRASFRNYSMATPYSRIEDKLIELYNDNAVKKIVLDIDSGGGTSDDSFEVAKTIREINKSKEITAYCNSAFSSAYLLASQAGKIVVTSTSGVGSIGAIYSHFDISKKNENEGINVTNIKSGSKKDLGTNSRSLSKEDFEDIQSIVNNVYDKFAAMVNEGRGISLKAIDDMQAGNFFGDNAVKNGLADVVGDFSSLIVNEESKKTFYKGLGMSNDVDNNPSSELNAENEEVNSKDNDAFKREEVDVILSAKKKEIYNDFSRMVEAASLIGVNAREMVNYVEMMSKGMSVSEVKNKMYESKYVEQKEEIESSRTGQKIDDDQALVNYCMKKYNQQGVK